jgi:hypothetical protein
MRSEKKPKDTFPSTIPEGMENVTLIVDATPLPIQHCRNDTKEKKEKKEYGMEHIKCGGYVSFSLVTQEDRYLSHFYKQL